MHLAYSYALPQNTTENHSYPLKLNRLCTVYTIGIHWLRNGVTTLVELVDHNQCVILFMSCEEGSELNMVNLRREIIREIVSHQKAFCPSIRAKEFLIDPSEVHLPVNNSSQLTLYDVEVFACQIQSETHCVYITDITGKRTGKVSDLLPFESIESGTCSLSILAGRSFEVCDGCDYYYT